VACARVNGVEITYELIGSGDEVVAFLNGIAMSIGHWKPLAVQLEDRYRCLSHDFRGQLLSPQAPRSGAAITLADHVEDLRCLLDQLGVRAAHIIGTSYGAEVGLLFAGTHPQRVASLVLIDGVSEMDPLLRATAEAWRAAALCDPVVFYRSIIPWNYSAAWLAENREKLASREESIAALPRGYFEDFAALCDAFLALDLAPQLPRICCPTLVVVGEKDILKHSGFARIMAKGIRGARMETIPGAGHAVVIEQPQAVLEQIQVFLAGPGRA
jgi:3-oxoadipate enol-lactonase